MQQVNLYNGLLLPKPEPLPLSFLWVAVTVAVVLTIGLWFMQWTEITQVEQQLQQLTQQKNQLQQQLLGLESIVLSAEERNIAERKLQNLQKQLEQQQKTSALIAQLNQQQTRGYFGVMEDLSKIDQKQLWLTRIHLDAGRLSLEGKTFEAAAVANMVNKLQGLTSTKQVSFKQVIIEKESKTTRAVNFYLYADNQGAIDEH